MCRFTEVQYDIDILNAFFFFFDLLAMRQYWKEKWKAYPKYYNVGLDNTASLGGGV